jgi:hypothetical protein
MDGLQFLAVTMTNAQFTTMEERIFPQGQFWELDATVWQRALRFPDSADREQTTKQDHAHTILLIGRSANHLRGMRPCSARRTREH